MSREREDNIQYLLDQVARLTAENAMLKEKWSTPEQFKQEPKFNFDLERMKAAIESPISDVTVDDLAKQVKQEPVAWMVETHFNNEPIKEFHTVKPMERVYKYCKVTELFAEKHHGIGGER